MARARGMAVAARPARTEPVAPGLERRRALDAKERALLARAGLEGRAQVEAWKVIGTNRQLAYGTHGIFRFFGKFPPPLARHLIASFTAPGERVLDPMSGSGTTAVEARALGRHVVVRDVSPLSILLARTKTTHVPRAASTEARARCEARLGGAAHAEPIGLRGVDHWFLAPTRESLGRLKAAIDAEEDGACRDLLLTAFASTVRRVSRATTQQGRLVLDAAKAREDAWPTFVERFEAYAGAVDALPAEPATEVRIERRDARQASDERFRLAIVHPPYFNNYKYSSINALELSWLGVPPAEVRGAEIREAFKLGKPEKAPLYVDDLAAVIEATAGQLEPGGTLALMMGDTTIRDTYLDVTRAIVDRAAALPLALDRIVVRVPQYTEASWVASQRRSGAQVGVSLYDFVLLFTRR